MYIFLHRALKEKYIEGWGEGEGVVGKKACNCSEGMNVKYCETFALARQ